MKALSLWQPHGTAIALGLKPWETRDWPTSYRGPLAIHAAKRRWEDAGEWHERARQILGRHGQFPALLKKVRRGDRTLDQAREDILREVADIITYADLIMSSLDADTGFELLRKFDEVSARRGYPRVMERL